MAHKTKRTYYLELTAAFCLLLGGSIYLIFRRRTLIMFRYIPQKIISLLDNVGKNISLHDNSFTSFIIYNLPAGLWTISYLLVMHTICSDMSKIQRMLWLYLLPSVLLLVEILQAFPFCRGTFDFIDILCYLIPIFVSLLIDKKNEKF